MEKDPNLFYGTTILSVRKNNEVVLRNNIKLSEMNLKSKKHSMGLDSIQLSKEKSGVKLTDLAMKDVSIVSNNMNFGVYPLSISGETLIVNEKEVIEGNKKMKIYRILIAILLFNQYSITLINAEEAEEIERQIKKDEIRRKGITKDYNGLNILKIDINENQIDEDFIYLILLESIVN